jgi:hypothetical protein
MDEKLKKKGLFIPKMSLTTICLQTAGLSCPSTFSPDTVNSDFHFYGLLKQ